MLRFLSFVLFGVLVAVSPLNAEEFPCQAKLDSVGVFKNGIFIARQTVTVPGPGSWVFENVPQAIHGTFFVECNLPVTTRTTTRTVEIPLEQWLSASDPRRFLGKKIRFVLRSEVLEGTLLATPQIPVPNHSLAFPPSAGSSFGWSTPPQYSSGTDTYVLQKESGELVFFGPQATPDRIELLSPPATTQEKPVLLFEIPDSNQQQKNQPIEIHITWLGRGISWAPSYQLNLTAPDRLTLEQTATLANEWQNIPETSISLISGYPQVPFENVPSLVTGISLANFFQRLDSPSGSVDTVQTRQAVMFNSIPSGNDAGFPTLPAPVSEGADTFYRSIGPLNIPCGDRITLSLDKREVPCQKTVCWNILDTRDSEGQNRSHEQLLENQTNRYGQTNESDASFSLYQEPWDTIQFKNPFETPLTTGVASVFEGERFRGQTTIYWVNPQEETSLGVNKALSIRVHSREEECPSQKSDLLPPGLSDETVSEGESGERQIRMNGYLYRLATVEVTMTAANQRAESTKLVIRRRFTGEPVPHSETLPAEENHILLGNAGPAINRRHEKKWSLTLAPGEVREIQFSYQILIRL